jgi:hypothetical protein
VVDEGPRHDQGVTLYMISAFRINKPVADEGPRHDQGVTCFRILDSDFFGFFKKDKSRTISIS